VWRPPLTIDLLVPELLRWLAVARFFEPGEAWEL
jgi:hypothetical protein